MKTTPWRDIQHKASPEEREAARRAAKAEAEQILRKIANDDANAKAAANSSDHDIAAA